MKTAPFTSLHGLVPAAGLVFALLATPALSGPAQKAIDAASKAGQPLFLVFYDKPDKALSGMEKELSAYNKSAAKKAAVCKTNVSSAADAEVVNRYGANKGAQLPLLLVFAGNGIITGGYPGTVTADQLKGSTSVPDCILSILQPLQEQKLVVVSLKNGKTVYNREAGEAIAEFARDARLKGRIAVVEKDPADPKNVDLLKQCGLTGGITQATTVLLAPPGSLLKVFSGMVTQNDLFAALSSCSPGGSCCPKK